MNKSSSMYEYMVNTEYVKPYFNPKPVPLHGKRLVDVCSVCGRSECPYSTYVDEVP